MSGVSEKDKFQYFQVPETPMESIKRAMRAITRFARSDDERAMFIDQVLGEDTAHMLGT